MAKYVLKFSKEGYFKYTSHLDLLRFFKRSFKRAGIKLDYSHGFNPHPKMGFAQPLSLGYSSIYELLEFETIQEILTDEIKDKLKPLMPEGLAILDCAEYKQEGKSLAALTEAAEYVIGIPLAREALGGKSCEELRDQFLSQEHIFVKKKQKKSKEFIDLDIKPKIMALNFSHGDDQLILVTTLDAGSESNLSPELLIHAVLLFLRAEVFRYDIEVMRKKLLFSNHFSI